MNDETNIKYLTTGDVCHILMISRPTLITWEISGKLVPAFKNSNGYRYYKPEDVDKLKKA